MTPIQEFAHPHLDDFPPWQECIEDLSDYIRHDGYGEDIVQAAAEFIDEYCDTDEDRNKAVEYFGSYLGEDEEYEALKSHMSSTTFEQREAKRHKDFNEEKLLDALGILESIELEDLELQAVVNVASANIKEAVTLRNLEQKYA